MRFVSITYTRKSQFHEPSAWLQRVRAYIGILEALSREHPVISIDRIDYEGEFHLNGVQHIFPEVGNGMINTAWKLNRYAKLLKPDIVLVQGMIFPLQVILLRWQLGWKVRIIIQNHAEKPGRRYRKFFQQLADPMVDAYLFAAKEMGIGWLKEHIIRRPEKIREVMEASSVFALMDRQEAKAYLGIGGDPIFLWVGRLDSNKDPLTVVKAFLEFTVLQPAARLYMIFHTAELLSDVEALIDAAPRGKELVLLVGEKEHEEMGWWYNAADFVVSGSHYEGSGVAVCEAMSCGCIPLLTDILSFRTMTAGGSCGVLYEVGNTKALLSAMLLAAGMDRDTERAKVLKQFRSALSFEAIADTIQKIAASL